ncbi:uroporphyrinogen-III C-methyltransferase [Aestuariimicrobium soli]|uniref:uroporphyrinogen-III C-methyltransferase n=1 Tax=Aestuariimicrobium soli TaxID=2035834 RepID=UPI003EBF71CB
MHSPSAGRVTLVGGGPGDPGLVTRAGAAALIAADVVLTDHLAPRSLIAELNPDAEIIDVGKIPRGEFTPQETINRLLVEHARRGRDVVRFKGGDSFVFGRGGEEWLACTAAGVDVRVIPGVTSAVSVPELAGIPVTHRGVSQGFVVVSGHIPPDDPRNQANWSALAASGLTLVILMGVASLPAIAATLVAEGLPADTPAAVVADGGLPSQRRIDGTLATIATLAEQAAIAPPAVCVVGEVVRALD